MMMLLKCLVINFYYLIVILQLLLVVKCVIVFFMGVSFELARLLINETIITIVILIFKISIELGYKLSDHSHLINNIGSNPVTSTN